MQDRRGHSAFAFSPDPIAAQDDDPHSSISDRQPQNGGIGGRTAGLSQSGHRMKHRLAAARSDEQPGPIDGDPHRLGYRGGMTVTPQKDFGRSGGAEPAVPNGSLNSDLEAGMRKRRIGSALRRQIIHLLGKAGW